MQSFAAMRIHSDGLCIEKSHFMRTFAIASLALVIVGCSAGPHRRSRRRVIGQSNAPVTLNVRCSQHGADRQRRPGSGIIVPTGLDLLLGGGIDRAQASELHRIRHGSTASRPTTTGSTASATSGAYNAPLIAGQTYPVAPAYGNFFFSFLNRSCPSPGMLGSVYLRDYVVGGPIALEFNVQCIDSSGTRLPPISGCWVKK